MSKLITYLLFGIRRMFGLFYRSYSSSWDSDLNYLLDTSRLVSVQSFTATFKHMSGTYHTIWINQDHRRDWFNYGHHHSVSLDYYGTEEDAYFNCQHVRDCDRFRPSLKTMLRLQKVVDSFGSSTYDNLKVKRKGEDDE